VCQYFDLAGKEKPDYEGMSGEKLRAAGLSLQTSQEFPKRSDLGLCGIFYAVLVGFNTMLSALCLFLL
jgi:hypothetical protein